MLFNNILRILKSYRFSLIKIIFFELIYLIKGYKGYKGNNITFSNNNLMTNNIHNKLKTKTEGYGYSVSDIITQN